MVSMDLVFSGTDSSDTVTVVVEVDMAVEDDETFTLTLTAGDSSLVEAMPEQAIITITDTTSRSNPVCDVCMCHLSLSPSLLHSVVTIGFDSDQYSVTEGQSVNVTVSVTSSGITLDRDVTVNVVGVPEEVTVEPEDITFSNDTLTHTVTVTALHDMVSGAMDVDISLTEDDPAVQLSPGTATLTISDASRSSIESVRGSANPVCILLAVVLGYVDPSYTFTEGDGGSIGVSVTSNPMDRTLSVSVTSAAPLGECRE